MGGLPDTTLSRLARIVITPFKAFVDIEGRGVGADEEARIVV
jgi:hypothetical protein